MTSSPRLISTLDEYNQAVTKIKEYIELEECDTCLPYYIELLSKEVIRYEKEELNKETGST